MVEDYGMSLKVSEEKSASPIGEDFKEDASRVGMGGVIGGLAALAAGAAATPVLISAGVGAGLFACVVGVKRLCNAIRDR